MKKFFIPLVLLASLGSAAPAGAQALPPAIGPVMPSGGGVLKDKLPKGSEKKSSIEVPYKPKVLPKPKPIVQEGVNAIPSVPQVPIPFIVSKSPDPWVAPDPEY